MVTFCALVCSARAQTITIKEKLDNGEYIVVIDGVEQRTITAAHGREINQRADDLDKCRRARVALNETVAKQEIEIDLLKKDAALADAQSKFERERALRFSAMYTLEHDLRLKSESVNARGSVNKFFDNPVVRVANEFGKPIVQSWLTSSFRRCN